MLIQVPRRLVTAVALAALALCTATAHAHSPSATSAQASPPEPAGAPPAGKQVAPPLAPGQSGEVPGVGPARGRADGKLDVPLMDGTTIQTHGGDPPHGTITDMTAAGPTTTIESDGCGFPTPGGGCSDPWQSTAYQNDPPCVGPTAKRTVFFYVYPSNRPNRYDSIGVTLRSYIKNINGVLIKEGRESSGGATPAQYNVACTTNNLAKLYVVQSQYAAGSPSLTRVINDLQGAGYSSSNAHYHAFMDDTATVQPAACGVGQVYDDTSKSSGNSSNGRAYSVSFAAAQAFNQGTGQFQDLPCWDSSTPMHEIGHNMGAVQPSAPFGTSRHHCSDEVDVMCYADGGTGGSTVTYNCDPVVYEKFDCNYNSYFDTNEESGEWLSSHWNLGGSENAFVQRG